jgi:hypothetical protein
VAHITSSLKGVTAIKDAAEPRVPGVYVEVITSKLLRSMTWLTVTGVTNGHAYVPFVVITMCSFPHSWLITRFVTRHVPIMERGLYLFGVPEFNPVFCGVQDCSVDTSFLCRFFCRSLFVLISFGQCICPSIYGFWLTLWYLQTFRITHILWKYN